LTRPRTPTSGPACRTGVVPSTDPEEDRDYCPDHEETVAPAFRRHVRLRLLTVEAHPLGRSREAVEAELDRQGYEVVESAPVDADSRITNFVAMRGAG
jgi:hypothetical protein